MENEVPFDGIITLLVFMVGVPAVVLQSLPAELRLVVTQRWGRLLRSVGIPVLAAFVVIITGEVLTGENGFAAPRWVWTLVFVALFSLVVLIAFRIPRRYGRRDAVVRMLEEEVGQTIAREGRLVEDSLHDLVEVGKQSEPGRDKEWVLGALANLTERVCAHERYNGDALQDLVLGVLDIVLNARQGRSAQNFGTATNLLRTIVTRYELSQDADFSQADLIAAIRALSRLGRAALGLENATIALNIVQASGGIRADRTETLMSQSLFEVGIAALSAQQMLIGMAALAQLVNLVDSRRPAAGELVADTLGLLAHFWFAGETAKEYARVRLERVVDSLEKDLVSALDAAADHCAQTTQFRTADLLRRLRRDVEAVASP